jgi:hypothetical protein
MELNDIMNNKHKFYAWFNQKIKIADYLFIVW